MALTIRLIFYMGIRTFTMKKLIILLSITHVSHITSHVFTILDILSLNVYYRSLRVYSPNVVMYLYRCIYESYIICNLLYVRYSVQSECRNYDLNRFEYRHNRAKVIVLQYVSLRFFSKRLHTIVINKLISYLHRIKKKKTLITFALQG